jgi:hypothetical protein
MRWKVIIAAALWVLLAVEVGSFLNQLRELEGDYGDANRKYASNKGTMVAAQAAFRWRLALKRNMERRARDAKIAAQAALRWKAVLKRNTERRARRPAQVSMNAADWNLSQSDNYGQSTTRLHVQHSANVNTQPAAALPTQDWGWKFSFFVPARTVSRAKTFYYLATTASPVLTQGHYIKMMGRIDGSDPGHQPGQQGSLSICWMFFQKVGGDLSGRGQYAYYHWWSTKPLIPNAGKFVQFVGLEPEFWLTDTGERGDASAAATTGFQQALANPQSIGIMCSGEALDDYDHMYGFDDQIIVGGRDYGGIATFTMMSFAVCDPFHLPQDRVECFMLWILIPAPPEIS